MPRVRSNSVRQHATRFVAFTAVGGAVGAVGIFALAQWVSGPAWVGLAGAVALGLLTGLLLSWHVKSSVLAPAGEALDEIEQTLERAVMMREAMQPALVLLTEGIQRQSVAIEDLARDIGHRTSDFDEDSAQVSPGFDSKLLYIKSALKDVRIDLASRVQISNTLSAANETIGVRLMDLHAAVRRLREALDSPALSGLPVEPPKAPAAPSAAETSEAPLPQAQVLPPMGPTPPAPKLAPPTWPIDTHAPLMDDFKLPRQPGHNRFKLE